MTLAALRGEDPSPTPDDASRTMREQVRDLAEHLGHIAQLALITTDPAGETPEHGADHLLDGLRELEPRIQSLRCLRGSSH